MPSEVEQVVGSIATLVVEVNSNKDIIQKNSFQGQGEITFTQSTKHYEVGNKIKLYKDQVSLKYFQAS